MPPSRDDFSPRSPASDLSSGSRSPRAAFSVRRVTGWITDVFRLGWGALYWNARKTWHILGGRRPPCPCQVASDSGLANHTGCEAVTHYAQPARFRVVCPLLTRRADAAWVCSVNAANVRPFWGRAILLFSLGGLGAYATAVLLVFLALHALGFRPELRQVAWPRTWPELRVVQSRHYLEQSREARAAGRPADALLALASAYELNPSDYAAGLLLAQLLQGAQPVQSDAVFARLYHDHSRQRESTGQAWYRSLLARGDFATIIPLARDRLLAPDGTQPSAWTQALLFACRRTGKPDVLAPILADPRLPAAPRELLALEQVLARQAGPERIRTLADALPAQRDAFAAAYLLRRLLDENRPDLMLSLIEQAGAQVGDREKALLRLDAFAALDRGAERASMIRRLLAQPSHPATWQLLSAHFITHPDRELLRLVAEEHRRDPLPANEAAYPSLLSWFAACGAAGDAELLQDASRLLAEAAARDSRAIERARQAFLAAPPAFRLENVLPLLQPLPIETTYALYARYAPAPAPPESR